MRSVPMLFVRDVVATSTWYQNFLGLTSGHGGAEFEMLMAGDVSVLQLHVIADDHHEHSVALEEPLGHGVVVVLYVDDAKVRFAHARELGLNILSDLVFNEQANMDEFTVRDPNGFSLMICKSYWG